MNNATDYEVRAAAHALNTLYAPLAGRPYDIQFKVHRQTRLAVSLSTRLLFQQWLSWSSYGGVLVACPPGGERHFLPLDTEKDVIGAVDDAEFSVMLDGEPLEFRLSNAMAERSAVLQLEEYQRPDLVDRLVRDHPLTCISVSLLHKTTGCGKLRCAELLYQAGIHPDDDTNLLEKPRYRQFFDQAYSKVALMVERGHWSATPDRYRPWPMPEWSYNAQVREPRCRVCGSEWQVSELAELPYCPTCQRLSPDSYHAVRGVDKTPSAPTRRRRR